jgi:hypothetical protein
MAWRDAQVDPRGQVGDREAAILFEFGKDLAVNAVHEQDPTPEPLKT